MVLLLIPALIWLSTSAFAFAFVAFAFARFDLLSLISDVGRMHVDADCGFRTLETSPKNVHLALGVIAIHRAS